MSLLQFTARRLVSHGRCCGAKKRFRLEMARPSSSKKCVLFPSVRGILEGFVQEVESVFQFKTFEGGTSHVAAASAIARCHVFRVYNLCM